jgi:hypothetical protein
VCFMGFYEIYMRLACDFYLLLCDLYGILCNFCRRIPTISNYFEIYDEIPKRLTCDFYGILCNFCRRSPIVSAGFSEIDPHVISTTFCVNYMAFCVISAGRAHRKR